MLLSLTPFLQRKLQQALASSNKEKMVRIFMWLSKEVLTFSLVTTRLVLLILRVLDDLAVGVVVVEQHNVRLGVAGLGVHHADLAERSEDAVLP